MISSIRKSSCPSRDRCEGTHSVQKYYKPSGHDSLDVFDPNVSAIGDDRAVVFRSTISRCEFENALFKDTDGEGSNKCSIMFFVEKEMLLVTKFFFEPCRNPTLLCSLCPKVPVGVLDISLGGEVRCGPLYPDPV